MFMIPVLIQAISDDSARALMENLYINYNHLMFSTAWRYCTDRQSAEDIVSDSCIAFINHLEKIQTLNSNVLKSYIVSTVRNTAINFLKRKKQADARVQYVSDEVMAQIASADSVERQVELQDEIAAVLNAVYSLPDKEQAVLRMKYGTDWKDEEIAAAVGLSESSVRKYVIRARKKVKNAVYRKEGKD